MKTGLGRMAKVSNSSKIYTQQSVKTGLGRMTKASNTKLLHNEIKSQYRSLIPYLKFQNILKSEIVGLKGFGYGKIFLYFFIYLLRVELILVLSTV